MNALVQVPRLMEHPVGVWAKSSSPSRGATDVSKIVEKRIKSLQRLTNGAVSEIGELPNSKPRLMSLEQKLAIKLSAMRRIIGLVSMYLEASWRQELLTSLDRFLSADDWEDELVLPSEQSFATFLRSVIYLHPTKRPGLGLSANGNFLASWSKERDRIVIECLAKDEIRWVISQTIDGMRESGAGKNQIHRLPELIAGYQPDRFFQNGEKILT